MRILLLLATLLIGSQAQAFTYTVNYSDPSSRMSAFFEDTSRSERSPVGSRWLTEEEIRDGWAKFLAAMNENPFSSRCTEFWPGNYSDSRCRSEVREWLNWELWLQLNLDAARVWQALVECNGGNPEAARIAYYRRGRYCGGDRESSKRISAELLALHGNVKDFSDSTEVKFFSKLQDNERLRQVSRLLPVHPLFSQALLEYFSTLVRFHKRSWNDLGDIASDTSWIDGQPNRSFGQRVGEITEGNVDVGSPKYATARAYVNIHLLVNLLPMANREDVQQWGLWPEASALLYYLAGQQYLLGKTGGSNDFFSLLFSMTKDFPEIPFPEIIRDGNGAIVTEFRAMAESFGFPTFRKRFCSHKPLIFKICFAVDPANPDETMEDY